MAKDWKGIGRKQHREARSRTAVAVLLLELFEKGFLSRSRAIPGPVFRANTGVSCPISRAIRIPSFLHGACLSCSRVGAASISQTQLIPRLRASL